MRQLLRISNLQVRFPSFEGEASVIDKLNLAIDRGEKVALVGESGCGKSLTARIILGLINRRRAYISGQIRFDGTDLLTLSSAEWRTIRGRRISMIFQNPSAALNPVFTVGEQLATAVRRGGSANNLIEAKALAREMLDRMSVVDPDRVLSSYPFQLSGGLNQRVLISMALINRPDLILADEPGTALDVTIQEQVLREMSNLAEMTGTAVLLISHNLGVVRAFTDRIYVMYAGQIVESAKTEALFRNPMHPYTAALFRAVPRLSADVPPRGIEGTIPDYVNAPSGCRFRPRCSHAVPDCGLSLASTVLEEDHRVRCVLYSGKERPYEPADDSEAPEPSNHV